MSGSSRAVHSNPIAKVVFAVAGILIALAPPTARAGGAAGATPDFRFCQGYFALCAASTCTPTGNQIAVNTINGGTRNFPEADCTCPVILGTSIANLSGGNMQGSCDAGAGHLWSTYQARPDIPQALTNWIAHLPEDAAPPQVCPGRPNRQYAQCFSFSCDIDLTQPYINNVPVVTCHCAIGATLAGLPAPPASSFPTQAGQGDQAICDQLPIGNVIQIPSP
ncbi:MAG: hypothetical protein JO266_09795 [Acidobacteria bacterium]|nr:hypothetical protein [Acidobacteriota bacterium]